MAQVTTQVNVSWHTVLWFSVATKLSMTFLFCDSCYTFMVPCQQSSVCSFMCVCLYEALSSVILQDFYFMSIQSLSSLIIVKVPKVIFKTVTHTSFKTFRASQHLLN